MYLQRDSGLSSVSAFQAKLQNDLEYWSDFELAMGAYTKEFSGKNLSSFVEVMDDVQSQLMQYLRSQEERVDYEGKKKEITAAIRELVLCFYHTLKPEEQEEIEALLKAKDVTVHRFHFINFNYTLVLDRCLAIAAEQQALHGGAALKDGITDKFGKVLHIHGTTKGYSILGVNDESQIANREAAFDEWFQRRFIKPLSNETLRGGNDRDAIRCITRSRIVCIFGMSFGKTDGSWWWTVCKWLLADSTRRLILFAGSKECSAEERRVQVLQQFFDGAALDEEEARQFSKLEHQIFVAPSEGVFGVELVKGEKSRKAGSR